MLKFSGSSCLISDTNKDCKTKCFSIAGHLHSYAVRTGKPVATGCVGAVETACRVWSTFELDKRRLSLAF
jgi:hypothetical protein